MELVSVDLIGCTRERMSGRDWKGRRKNRTRLLLLRLVRAFPARSAQGAPTRIAIAHPASNLPRQNPPILAANPVLSVSQ